MHNFSNILACYAIESKGTNVTPFGSGLIHETFLVETLQAKYILQKVNTNVFRQPEVIASNIGQASAYLSLHYPDYVFPGLIQTADDQNLLYDGLDCWKLSAFIANTYTQNKPSSPEIAYQGARAFALLTKNLQNLPMQNIGETIPDFHNLTFRYTQFLEALNHAIPDRLLTSKTLINQALEQKHLVETYTNIVADHNYPIRMIHHDTKINNVLFDKTSQQSVAVCDLDTLMKGRIISDLGDIIRTYACSQDENHIQPSEVFIQKEYLEACHAGYLNVLGPILCPAEIQQVDFAGQFMIYMQAIRFLSDYLTGDTYYGKQYPEHNFDRAANQFALLRSLQEL